MNLTAGVTEMTVKEAQTEVIKTLAYFNIFQYPLTAKEIRQFLNRKISEQELQQAIAELVNEQAIFQNGSFYSLRNDNRLAERRTAGNNMAAQLLPKAAKIGAFLYKFPYVRGVAVSGSLSKNFADENADIDFFIITRANRLWIARTILHLFKKITFLNRTQHFYCMNYFVDEEALPISDKNVYTAIEIITILPFAGRQAIQRFFMANSWAQQKFPNHAADINTGIAENGSWFKIITEFFLNNAFGNWLDNVFCTWSSRRWKKKEKIQRRNIKGAVMGLITDKHFAKSNPESFQEKVLQHYEDNLRSFLSE